MSKSTRSRIERLERKTPLPAAPMLTIDRSGSWINTPEGRESVTREEWQERYAESIAADQARGREIFVIDFCP